tara:strand:+ start:474 stop:935 length:462 start_codon:yes stop_codon:yes gene_type:complete
MKIFILLFSLFFSGCLKDRITENQAIELLNNYFYALDIENFSKNIIDDYITDDYFIYEAEKKMPTEDFKDFINNAFNSRDLVSTEWKFSDIRVSTDYNSAHISYINDGSFLSKDGTIIKSKWLETGYMVKTPNGLKMKFMFSDNIERKIISPK